MRIKEYLSSWVSLENLFSIILIVGTVGCMVAVYPKAVELGAEVSKSELELKKLKQEKIQSEQEYLLSEIKEGTARIIEQIAECQLILDDIILSLEEEDK